MKILFFARRFYPEIGGVEKHVFELSKELQKKNHSITVITEMPAHIAAKQAETYEGIRIIRIHTGGDDWFKKFRIWHQMSRLQTVMQNADVIHCHDVFFWYLPFRFLYFSKPVYTTFHGYEGYPLSQKAIRMRKVSEVLSSGNICIGDFMKKWYGTNPTAVSYGAVTVPKEYNDKPMKESAVFFGRLDDQTGILTYDEAIKKVKTSYPNFDFLVIGEGEYKNKIDNARHIQPFQKSPETYFQTYHFAFVSRYLSILEAFAAKRLVFAVYDNPLKEDYLRMTPYAKYIIIEKDGESLSKQIMYYMKNKEKEKALTEEAFNWVTKQNWENVTQLYIKLWQKSIIKKVDI